MFNIINQTLELGKCEADERGPTPTLTLSVKGERTNPFPPQGSSG